MEAVCDELAAGAHCNLRHSTVKRLLQEYRKQYPELFRDFGNGSEPKIAENKQTIPEEKVWSDLLEETTGMLEQVEERLRKRKKNEPRLLLEIQQSQLLERKAKILNIQDSLRRAS